MKLFNDILKNSRGKYSRKSLIIFISFIVSIIIGGFIVVSNLLFDVEINPYAIQVFYGFLTLAGGTTVMTVWDKFKNRLPEEPETNAN